MLKIKLQDGGFSVSDFQALEWAESMLRIHQENDVTDTTIYIANETCMRAFELLVMRGDINPGEIEFYFQETKLEFDEEFGIMCPKEGWKSPANKIQNETLSVIHQKWLKRKEN